MKEICKDPEKPHTIWYWIEDPNDPAPVPSSITVDNRREAMNLVNPWIKKPRSDLSWIKIFRFDNENYTCFKWTNPNSEVQVEES